MSTPLARITEAHEPKRELKLARSAGSVREPTMHEPAVSASAATSRRRSRARIHRSRERARKQAQGQELSEIPCLVNDARSCGARRRKPNVDLKRVDGRPREPTPEEPLLPVPGWRSEIVQPTLTSTRFSKRRMDMFAGRAYTNPRGRCILWRPRGKRARIMG